VPGVSAGWTVVIDGRKGVDLIPGQRQADAVFVHPLDGGDGYGHLLAAKQVTLLQQDMRHMLIAAVDDKPLDLAYASFPGAHILTPSDGDLAYREGQTSVCSGS
jgi:hypothetical protein